MQENMWVQIITMMVSFSHTVSVVNRDCNIPNCKNAQNEVCVLLGISFEPCENVKLRNCNIVDIERVSSYANIKTLDLSYNKLKKLPEDFLNNAIDLEEINLANNCLEKLPIAFLNNSSKLQVVHLEGNLLSEIPSSLFHLGLLNLSVDCRCDVASSIIQHKKINSTEPSTLSVMCNTSSSILEIDNFFAHNCGSQMLQVLYIILPIVALGLVMGGLGLYLWKKRKNSCDFENKPTSDKSPSHGQPRYMTRQMDAMAATSNQGQRQDYENVFVGNPSSNILEPYEYIKEQKRSGAHSKQTKEEPFYLESDVNEGDQPIYSNTEGVYYNYQEPSHINMIKEEDDVYILPDH